MSSILNIYSRGVPKVARNKRIYPTLSTTGSGGGGGSVAVTPSLQKVTDVGATTNQKMTIAELTSKAIYSRGFSTSKASIQAHPSFVNGHYYSAFRALPSNANSLAGDGSDVEGGLYMGAVNGNHSLLSSGSFYYDLSYHTAEFTSSSIIDLNTTGATFKFDKDLVKGTNYLPTERLRIDDEGIVLLGNTATSRRIKFESGEITRWTQWANQNSISFARHDSNGDHIDVPFEIDSSAGSATFLKPLTHPDGIGLLHSATVGQLNTAINSLDLQKVTENGNTSNLSISVNGLTTPLATFTPQPVFGTPLGRGVVKFGEETDDLVIGNKFGTFVQASKTAHETFIANEPIAKGQVVYVAGGTGDGNVNVNLASNHSYNENWRIGVAASAGNTGEEIDVFWDGQISGLDTSSLQYGTPLYLGEVHGSITNTRPIFPEKPYIVGTLVYQHVTDGVLGVGVVNDLYQQEFDGTVVEKQQGYFRHELGKTYLDLEKFGGGDLPVQLGSKTHILDCTTGGGLNGRATVELIQGTATTIALNRIYLWLDNGVLTLSTLTSYLPAPYAMVGYVGLKDYATSSTYGAIITRRITTAKNHDGRGRISYMMERSTIDGVKYESGINPSVTITDGTPDIVDLSTIDGEFYQNHRQLWTANNLSTVGAIVLNASGNGDLQPLDIIYNLSDCDELSDGTPVNNERMHITVVGLGNAQDEQKRYGILLPNASYGNGDSEAYKDYNNTATTSVTNDFKITAFLIARVPLKFTSGGNNAEFINPIGSPEIVSLLGQPLGASSTGGVGGASFIPTLEQVNTVGATSSVKMAYATPQLFDNDRDIVDKEYVDTVANTNFQYEQVIPQSTWTIAHNLGKYPSVTVIDSSGTQVIGEVNHIDTNNLTISFNSGNSGIASLN